MVERITLNFTLLVSVFFLCFIPRVGDVITERIILNSTCFVFFCFVISRIEVAGEVVFGIILNSTPPPFMCLIFRVGEVMFARIIPNSTPLRFLFLFLVFHASSRRSDGRGNYSKCLHRLNSANFLNSHKPWQLNPPPPPALLPRP